jgi:hypothetical protein
LTKSANFVTFANAAFSAFAETLDFEPKNLLEQIPQARQIPHFRQMPLSPHCLISTGKGEEELFGDKTHGISVIKLVSRYFYIAMANALFNINW